jgi:hypothetical protein
MSYISEAVLLQIQNMSAYDFRPLTQIWYEEPQAKRQKWLFFITDALSCE